MNRPEEWWGDEAEHAPRYAVSGNAEARPSRVSQPWPPDGAVDVPTDVDLGWVPSTSAVEHRLRLGPEGAEPGEFAVLPPLADGANVGTLQPGRTYVWRVDTVNANELRTGQLWRFVTDPNGEAGPGLASGPQPADRTTGVPHRPTLPWDPAADVTAQEVWFGPTDAPLALLTTLGPDQDEVVTPALEGGRVYRWRVDGLAGSSHTTGDVWRFGVTSVGLPGRPSDPAPAHLGDGVPTSGIELGWSAAQGATGYRVHLGTSHPLPQVHEGPTSSWTPGTLHAGQVYYWRVDAVGDRGTRRGATWRFET